MELKIISLLAISIIFLIQYNVPVTNALAGRNLMLVMPREYSYIVAFIHFERGNLNRQQNLRCSGALISRYHVLSAASCIEIRRRNETAVVAESTILSQCHLYQILWWITYNEWIVRTRTNLEFPINDISITKLRRAVRDVIPGMLSPLNNRALYGQTVQLAGWGITNDGTVPLNMLTGSTIVLGHEECVNRLSTLEGYRVNLHPRHLCSAANPYILMNLGDIGGPVIFNNMIAGVNKAAVPLPHIPLHPDKVNLHTGIHYYRDFIAHAINPEFRWS